MILRLATLALASLSLAACASAPQQRYGRFIQPVANPGKVVATEIAFARMAQDEGQWTAFSEYAAEDGMMFVPQPANARTYLKGRDNPSEAIRWQPHHVWSSCDGSLAVTRGAWQRPDGATGYFTTVWERQPDGEYRWLLDQGDLLEEPLEAPEFVQTDVADCPEQGMADDLRKQAEQERLPGGGTYFDQISSDASLFLTFVVSPDLSRHWKLMLNREGRMVDAMSGDVAAPPAQD